MITVIEHGPKKIKARCPHCGCIFEYELEDVRTESIVITGSSYMYVECPDCKYHVFHDYFKLDESKAPEIWYDRIEDIRHNNPEFYNWLTSTQNTEQAENTKYTASKK